MTLHIIWVRMSSYAPTIAPIATRSGFLIARPETDAATPESELRSDTVIGMSAPPTRIVKRTPYINAIISAIIVVEAPMIFALTTAQNSYSNQPLKFRKIDHAS